MLSRRHVLPRLGPGPSPIARRAGRSYERRVASIRGWKQTHLRSGLSAVKLGIH